MNSPARAPQSHWQASLRYYLPVLGWAALILLLSTGGFGGGATLTWLHALASLFDSDVTRADLRGLHAALRKLAHVGEYFVLALLLWRALRQQASDLWRWRWAAAALAAGVALAALDELHQTFEPGRAGSLLDVGFDTLGVVCALLLLYWRAGRLSGERS